MKLTAIAVTLLILVNIRPVVAQELLTGDTKLACEAILCLSSGQRPDECQPSIERYFGINKRKMSDTIKARIDFLRGCPASEDSEVKELTSALANGAGRCDAESLNSGGFVFGFNNGISDVVPSYCNTYYSNPLLTDLVPNLPRYVGSPDSGGYWVPASQYEAALAEYNARIANENTNYGG